MSATALINTALINAATIHTTPPLLKKQGQTSPLPNYYLPLSFTPIKANNPSQTKPTAINATGIANIQTMNSNMIFSYPLTTIGC
jgi:hypothetical protein